MIPSVALSTAFCLSQADVDWLGQGRHITAISAAFVRGVPNFALCPLPHSPSEATQINYWAHYEACKLYQSPEELEKLSLFTAWSFDYLTKILQEQQALFVIQLRVYKLPSPIHIPAYKLSIRNSGKFIRLPEIVTVNLTDPILDDQTFQKRVRYLNNAQKLPLFPRREDYAQDVDWQEDFTQAIATYLKSHQPTNQELEQKYAWIKTIAALGDRSIEEETGQVSSYQAGTNFENITRRGLEFIGFKVDEEHRGGAGGLDLYCSSPYDLLVECKSGKTIPIHVIDELTRLARKHFNKEKADKAHKLIVGPGIPTDSLKEDAKNVNVSIMNPNSLQRLVELQAQYPNSIDLIKLKGYLEPGSIDHKIDEYIQTVIKDVQKRTGLMTTVKQLQEQNLQEKINELENQNFGVQHFDVKEVRTHYNAIQNPKLGDGEVRDILIELSSPLVGCLGRIPGTDLFYFLRDLPEPNLSL